MITNFKEESYEMEILPNVGLKVRHREKKPIMLKGKPITTATIIPFANIAYIYTEETSHGQESEESVATKGTKKK